MTINKQLIQQYKDMKDKTNIDRWLIHITNSLSDDEVKGLITALQGLMVKDDNE